MRVLVVEDDADLNRQLVGAFKEAGYAVDTATDGEEGHFLGETEPYDAVVLDIGLPQLDGISVLEQWRRAGRAMPVLLLTARDRWSDKVQGIDAGADDYVAKPKSNFYRSLHTAVVGPGGRSLEVQIRTREMHEQSEYGIAAHWRYKEGNRANRRFDEKINWLRQRLTKN